MSSCAFPERQDSRRDKGPMERKGSRVSEEDKMAPPRQESGLNAVQAMALRRRGRRVLAALGGRHGLARLSMAFIYLFIFSFAVCLSVPSAPRMGRLARGRDVNRRYWRHQYQSQYERLSTLSRRLREDSVFSISRCRFTLKELEDICRAFGVPEKVEGFAVSNAIALFFFLARWTENLKVKTLAALTDFEESYISKLCSHVISVWGPIATNILQAPPDMVAKFMAPYIWRTCRDLNEKFGAGDLGPNINVWGAIDGTKVGICRYEAGGALLLAQVSAGPVRTKNCITQVTLASMC